MSDDLTGFVSADLLPHIAPGDRHYLEGVFTRFHGRYPTLEELWGLMDEAWSSLGCDQHVVDSTWSAFYEHPVWLLNGLFIEQHALSLAFRDAFTGWVADQSPRRVADLGGGFGTLARCLGRACPSAQVEIIEPHATAAAVALAERTPNVRFRPTLSGSYDVVLAIDVFEHLPDPLGLAYDAATHLREQGTFLIANCFYPVIRCHLPQSFHFRWTWDATMRAMGLHPMGPVAYGMGYQRRGALALHRARATEIASRRLYTVTRYLPGRVARAVSAWLR